MKTLLVLGAGTAGTMMARKMASKLDSREWKVILVDSSEHHYYQPGFLFVPFKMYKPEDVVRPIRSFVPRNIEMVFAQIELIEPDANRVKLSGGRIISYDYLVIATGCDIRPEETEGMMDGWRNNVHDFYTYDGSVAMRKYLETFEGGRVVVNIVETPIKCPVAPLEFLCLADDFFTRKGIRNKVELIFATPLTGAFTKPIASAALGDLLKKKGVIVESEFAAGEVDADKGILRSYDEREIPFDLLVSIPVNMGAEVIRASGMGDALNYVATDQHTLQSKNWPNVWVMGDATNLPTSKAGAVIHFQMEAAVENMLAHMAGKEMHASFDGHSMCYIESGHNKAVLIDFNYEHEPYPGTYPLPKVGPFSLLRESVFNHLGKLAFHPMYWHLMLKGIEVPLPTKFSMVGKEK